MFMIQGRKLSNCIRDLMIVLLEFSLVGKSTSNQKICENSNTRSIFYFKESNDQVDRTEAWRRCNNSRFTLPVICNQHEQDALTNFLKTNIGSSTAWTAGEKTSFNEWKWVDGQLFNNRTVINVKHEHYTHGALEQDRSYSGKNPKTRNYYLCQYTGSSCNSENDIPVINGCVRPSGDDRAWHDARNQCLKNGGDLAILTDADLGTIIKSNKLNARNSYWIGLRKNAWYWSLRTTVPSDVADEEITFINWSTFANSLSDNCISIDARNGGWIADKCNSGRKVICQTSSDKGTSGQSSSTMSSTTTTESQLLLYSGIGVGIAIITNLIIVIILTLRYIRKSNKDMNESIVTNNYGHNKLDLTQNKRATSLANAPVNAQVVGADDTQGVYAEISLSTVNEPENGTKPHQHGIVYASLDFQKEPIYQEVN